MMNEAPASSERMMTPDVVVTGEAVALEVRAASAGMRILSGLVDYTLYTGGLVMTLNTWLAITPADITLSGPMAMVELSLILLLWTLVLPLTIEVLSRGLSAGRLITGTRVVRDDGGAIRLRHSLVRTLLALIEIWATAGTLASLTCAATPRGKRLGDLLAGTYVVHVRSVTRGAPPVLMPPELAAWASQADICALPGSLALVARTFLQRASTMQPAPRTRLAVQLAAAVEPHVAPPAPAGTHPERFLAAVLAERRDREFILELRSRRADQKE